MEFTYQQHTYKVSGDGLDRVPSAMLENFVVNLVDNRSEFPTEFFYADVVWKVELVKNSELPKVEVLNEVGIFETERTKWGSANTKTQDVT